MSTRILPHKLGIYVPSLDRHGRALDHTARSSVITTVVFEMGAVCGGASALPAQGVWVDGAGNFMAEPSTLVYSYCTEQSFMRAQQVLTDMADKVGDWLDQAVVLTEVNGHGIMYEREAAE